MGNTTSKTVSERKTATENDNSCKHMSPSCTGANLRWQRVWEEKESCSNWVRNGLESISRQVIDINELPVRRHAKLTHILCIIRNGHPIIAMWQAAAAKTQHSINYWNLHNIHTIMVTYPIILFPPSLDAVCWVNLAYKWACPEPHIPICSLTTNRKPKELTNPDSSENSIDTRSEYADLQSTTKIHCVSKKRHWRCTL